MDLRLGLFVQRHEILKYVDDFVQVEQTVLDILFFFFVSLAHTIQNPAEICV